MSKETGGPAFPEPGLSGLPNGEFIHGQSGMTLRDYFAAKAMQAMISYGPWSDAIDMSRIAEYAYKQADAMLLERAK